MGSNLDSIKFWSSGECKIKLGVSVYKASYLRIAALGLNLQCNENEHHL